MFANHIDSLPASTINHLALWQNTTESSHLNPAYRQAMFGETLSYLRSDYAILPTQPTNHKKPYMINGQLIDNPLHLGNVENLILDKGTGIALELGGTLKDDSKLLALDIDFDHPEILSALQDWLKKLPGEPVIKVGRRGFTFFLRSHDPAVQLSSYSFYEGEQTQPSFYFDVLANGVVKTAVNGQTRLEKVQTTLPPSRPSQDKNYVWVSQPLHAVKPTHLPLINANHIQNVVNIIGNHSLQPNQLRVDVLSCSVSCSAEFGNDSAGVSQCQTWQVNSCGTNGSSTGGSTTGGTGTSGGTGSGTGGGSTGSSGTGSGSYTSGGTNDCM